MSSSNINSGLPSEYLSRETYGALEKELAYLTVEKRREISERLEESIHLGDLSENAEYQEAKEQQLMNEQRIAEIQDLLSRTIVLPVAQKTFSRIEMGCFVVLKKDGDETGCFYKYQIVGSEEADPVAKKISNESPLGSSLLRKKRGNKVDVLTPAGKIRYTVIDIV